MPGKPRAGAVSDHVTIIVFGCKPKPLDSRSSHLTAAGYVDGAVLAKLSSALRSLAGARLELARFIPIFIIVKQVTKPSPRNRGFALGVGGGSHRGRPGSPRVVLQPELLRATPNWRRSGPVQNFGRHFPDSIRLLAAGLACDLCICPRPQKRCVPGSSPIRTRPRIWSWDLDCPA
jgi:hypothetical protein